MPGGQFKWGTFLPKSNGGVHQGWLAPDGNRSDSANAKASFTGSPTRRPVTKVEVSDPTVRNRTAEAQRIKVTPGITG